MTAQLDLDDYLPYLLNRAGAKIADAFGQVARRHGITLQMWRVLAALHHQDGQSVGSLARTTSIEISTLSRLLDQMQKKRLLLRRRDSADQRSVAIHRSAAGEAITRRLIPVALDYEARALAGLAAAEAKRLKTLLRRVYANLDGLAQPDTAPRRSIRRRI
ncbi:MAG: MarR family winged helix-turn-helix transcriptional regulator [Reyranellaceae bacterium]